MKNNFLIMFFLLLSLTSYSQINLEKELKQLYLIKNSSKVKSTKYLNTLYNISVYEILLNNYDSAETSLVELIKYSPKNYSALTKLVTIYMNKGEFQKASPHREKLTKAFKSKETHNYFGSEKNLKKIIKIAPLDFDTYERLIQLYNEKHYYKKSKTLIDKIHKAHESGLFKQTSKDGFCIEEFLWKNYGVLAYEKFLTGNETTEKHLFYIFDKKKKDSNYENDKIIIGTEKKLNSNVYDLYLYKNQSYTYLKHKLKITYNYSELKEIVLHILEKELKEE